MLAFFVLLLLGLEMPDIWHYLNREKEKTTRAARATSAEAAATKLAALEAEPLAPIPSVGLVLRGQEVCYLQQDAQRFSLHPVRGRKGNYGGLSVPIGHGIRLNAGQMRQEYVQRSALQSDGRGDLSLTSLRLIFNTATANVSILLSHIAGLHGFRDGVRIDIENGAPITFITGDTRLFVMLGKVINGDVVHAL
jgi:hypothetical protein